MTGQTYHAQQSQTLVAMVNKDIYFLSKKDAARLVDLLTQEIPPQFAFIEDVRSGKQVLLAVANISSVVQR